MAPHQERVVTERNELGTKIHSLEKFFEGSVFVTLSLRERELLRAQFKAMSEYFDILTSRIEDFA